MHTLVKHHLQIGHEATAAADEIKTCGNVRTEHADHAVCREIIDTEFFRRHSDDGTLLKLVLQSLLGHVGDNLIGYFHFRRKMTLHLNVLRHERASAHRHIDTCNLALRLALLKTVDHIAYGISGLTYVEDTAVTDTVGQLLFLYSLHTERTGRIDYADGTFDFRAPYLKSHYIFFFHGGIIVLF